MGQVSNSFWFCDVCDREWRSESLPDGWHAVQVSSWEPSAQDNSLETVVSIDWKLCETCGPSFLIDAQNWYYKAGLAHDHETL